jgi:hypothetical protein
MPLQIEATGAEPPNSPGDVCERVAMQYDRQDGSRASAA